MSIDSEQVANWIGKGLAVEPGSTALPVDYVSINRRTSARSWPQHARIEAAGRAPLDVVGDVMEHLGDIQHNAAAEGLTAYAVRLLLYRASGIPAGSRTFRAELPGSGFDGEEDEGDGTLQGELVAVIRELRILVRDQGQQSERTSGLGYKLAGDALAQAAALQRENAALMVAMAETQGAGSDKAQHLAQLAQIVLPALPALLGVGAANAARARAAAEAAELGAELVRGAEDDPPDDYGGEDPPSISSLDSCE